MTKRVIWSNDYENTRPKDWQEGFEEFCELNDLDAETEDINTYISETLNEYLYDERCNLRVKVDGTIVAFCNLGLWWGKQGGIKVFTSEIGDTLYSDCDIATWYCDDEEYRCDAVHHDGTNHYIYRVVKDLDNFLKAFDDGKITSEQDFIECKYTESVKPYIDKVYGW